MNIKIKKHITLILGLDLNFNLDVLEMVVSE